jgi:hypothetical protein
LAFAACARQFRPTLQPPSDIQPRDYPAVLKLWTREDQGYNGFEHKIGAKATIPGTAGIDGKYQFLDAGKFALATGVGVGYLKLTSGSEGMEAKSTIVDTTVPVYASYDVARAFALSAAPKYVLRYASSTDSDGMSSSGVDHLVGATVGTRLGNRWGLFLESSYLQSVTSDFGAFQVNGSIFF